MSNARTIIRNTGFLVGADIISKILSLVFVVYIARVWGDAGFGKYSFVFSFVAVFALFSDLGIVPLLVREVSRDKKKAGYYLNNCLSLKLISTIIALALALAILPIYKSGFDVFLSVILISVAMIFANLSEILHGMFQAEQKMEYPAYLTILERIVTIGLGIYVISKGYGIVGFAVVYCFSYFVIFVISAILTSRMICRVRLNLDLNAAWSILRESYPFWLTVIFGTLYFRINTVMLNYFDGYEVVGWFSAAYAVLEMLVFIPAAFSRAVFPAMSELFVKNKDFLRELLQRAFSYVVMIAVPIAIGIALLSDSIIFLVYKDAFSNSALALRILIWAVMMLFPNIILGCFLNAINKQRTFTVVTAISAVLSIVLNAVLIPAYSYIGATIATVITEMIVLVVIGFYVRKEGYSFVNSWLILKVIFAGIVMAGILYLLKGLNLFVLIVIGAVTYFAVMYVVRAITNEDIKYFSGLVLKR